jgi:chromate transporter
MLPLSLLFKRFLKLGATAYGGPAIAGHMKKTIVKDLAWLKEPEFMQGIALCQLIPGATFVQMSAYIGYRLRGLAGALACMAGFVLPAFTLMVILSAIYFRFGDLWLVQSLFKGLAPIIVAIILAALISFGKPMVKDWKAISIVVLAFVGFLFHLSIVLVFLISGALALLMRLEVAGKASPSPSPSSQRKGNSPWLLVVAAIIIAAFLICYFLNEPLFHLSLIMAKVGALAFGGGFTTVGLIQLDVVDRFHWVSTKEFLDGIVMGQVTPGPIVITATFLGYKLAGFLGAAMATLAIFSSDFFILSLLIPYHDRLRRLKEVRIMEQGILAAFVGMLGLVLYNFSRTTFVDIPTVLFAAGAFIALLKKVDLAYILAAGAIASILLFGLLLA